MMARSPRCGPAVHQGVRHHLGGNMKRLLALAILVLFGAASITVVAGASRRIIDLNKTGAFEALQRDNPQHYETIKQIMEGIGKEPVAGVPRWMQTNFNARGIRYSAVLLTSAPPQRHLSFVLDETRYEATVTLTNVRAEIMPTK